MSKIYKIRMNCVGLKDYAVEADSKKQAREIVEQHHHQCDGTEFEFGEFLEMDDWEKGQAGKLLDENYDEVVAL